MDVFTHQDGAPRAARDILASDFAAPNQYQAQALEFETDKTLEDVEFRVLYSGEGELWLDAISITPLTPQLPG